MLWSESPEPTDYYYTHTGTWSGFWLLDSAGSRIVAGQYSEALADYLLNSLF